MTMQVLAPFCSNFAFLSKKNKELHQIHSLVYKDLTYKDQETPSTENFLKNKRFPGSPVLKISRIRDFLVHPWAHR